MPQDTRRHLLAVLAHPDDETFGCGGLLAKYAAEGAQVSLICATLGEAGEITDPSLATRETLARVREEELRVACDFLGIREIFILGYRDSGMAGTQDNQHPQAFCQVNQHEVVERIAGIIRRLRPQVIVTFDPNGGYGHPDHIAIHQATKEAFTAAGDPLRFGEQLINGLDAYRPSKLYYFGFPRSMTRAFQAAMVEAGIGSDFAEMDPETMGVPDEQITTVLNVREYVGQKEQAALCHRTQIQGREVFSWMPEALRERLLSIEHLIRAEPPYAPAGGAKEVDLFAGIPPQV